MNSKNIVIIEIVVILMLSMPTLVFSNNEGIEGDWNVTLSTLDISFVLQISMKPNGTLAAAIEGKPFDKVTFENGKLRLEGGSPRSILEGMIKEDGLTIEGQWQQGEQQWPVVLTRVEQVRTEAADKSDSKVMQASEQKLQARNKLIAWWKLDEADGNDVADSSGNGRVGRLFGNPQWRPAGGKVGGSLEFDGYGDYVEISNESAFDITGAITVAAWIKVNRFEKRWQTIVAKGDTSWRLQRTAEEDTLAFHCTGIASVAGRWPQGIEGNKDVNDGKWHHVVGVYDGSTVSLYIDGVLDNSSQASGAIQTNDFDVNIGGNSEQIDREWNGLIDEVCIIAGAIDATVVNTLYSGKDPMAVAEEAKTVTLAQIQEKQFQARNKLVAWWKFENNTKDNAGANPGIIGGSPTYVSGKFGQAISLDGDDYVDCGKPSLLDFGAGNWTISAWIKTTQSGTDDANEPNRGTVFANGGDEAGGIRYTLAVNEGQSGMITLTTDDDLSKVQAISTTVVNDGAWHHVVGMRNERTLGVYVDGVLERTENLPTGYDLSGASRQNAYIGVIADYRDGSLFKYFVGLIDEVCIFACALDANSVSALCSGRDPMKVAEETTTVPLAQASDEQLEYPISGKSSMAITLILVLGLVSVIGGIILFLVKSSIRT